MSKDISENDSKSSDADIENRSGSVTHNENQFDSIIQLDVNDISHRADRDQSENNLEGEINETINDQDQIKGPNSSDTDDDGHNVPLLAPLILNRPPFDVENFRRRMANIHRQGDEVFVNRNMAQRERLRGNSPPPLPVNREVAQIGLNDTPLTRALAMGDFDLAESIIMTINDPEYLNDGEHADTPLNIALDGRSTYVGKPRNLKIARLLVERGADANFRVPDNDLGFGQSESPIERLVTYYLDLLKVFKNNVQSVDASSGDNGTINHHMDDFSELLDTIGLNGETGLTSEGLIQQTRFLLDIFFANGADVNLHTTSSSRSIFHSVLCAEVTDPSLIEMMAQKGALINLTDVHGTTPFMDVIRYTDRAIGTYVEMKSLGKQLNLDVQNCSGDCALFRALFRGQLDTATLVLNEGEASIISRETRVQEAKPKRPSRQFRFSSYFRRKSPIRSIPAVIAPILCDSPCFTSNRRQASFSRYDKNDFYNTSNRKRTKFAVQTINNVIRAYISPLVDKGWFCQNELDQWIRKHIITHTDYRNLTENKVFQEDSMIPLMFGHLSSGLRQQCLRQLLVHILFNENSEAVVTMLKNLDRPSTSTPHKSNNVTRKNKVGSKNATKLEDAYHTDSACVLQSTLSDSAATGDKTRSTGDEGSTGRSSQMNLSESDLQASAEADRMSNKERSISPFRTSTPRLQNSSPRRRAVSLNIGVNHTDSSQEGIPSNSRGYSRGVEVNHRQFIFEGGSVGRALRERRHHNERRIGENWLLRQNNDIREHHDEQEHRGRLSNSYRPIRRYRNRPFRSLEGIELEISNNAGRIQGNAISESRQRVSRIRQMLEETDDMLQRLQLQVEEVQTERIARENDQILNRADELAEHCSQIGDQVAALEEFNQRVLMQGRNVLVTIKNTEEAVVNTDGAISNCHPVESTSRGSSNSSIDRPANASKSLEERVSTNSSPLLTHVNQQGTEDASNNIQNKDGTSSSQENEDFQRRVRDSSNQRFDRLISNTPNMNRSTLLRTEGSEYRDSSGDSSSSSSSDNDSFLATSESDQSWGGGAFSLSHTIRMRNRRSFASGDNSCSQRLYDSVESPNPCQEYILQMLKPSVIEKLAKKLGLPPGIIPCLELEVARLQLCLAINRYKTVECDVGCEQDESEAWDTSDSSETSDTDDELDHSNYDTDNDAPSFDNGDSFEETSNSDDDTSSFKSLDSSDNEERGRKDNSNFSFTTNCPRVFGSDSDSTTSNEDSSYIPSVPAKPRILTSSDEESSSYVSIVHSAPDEAPIKLNLHSENRTDVARITTEANPSNEERLLTETTSFCNDWFSIVGSNEHSSTKKYIQEKLGEDFSHSTDSSSNEEN